MGLFLRRNSPHSQQGTNRLSNLHKRLHASSAAGGDAGVARCCCRKCVANERENENGRENGRKKNSGLPEPTGVYQSLPEPTGGGVPHTIKGITLTAKQLQ